MRHVPLRELGYAIGFVALLAAIHVGAYYATVEKIELYAPGSIWDSHELMATWPKYRTGGSWEYRFYGPMHALDRKLRPGFWNAPGLPSE